MVLTVLLYLALAVFGIGLVYKVSTWFRYSVGLEARGITPSRRVAAAAKGILKTIFSPGVFVLLKVFVVDVVFQVRILRQDFFRWFTHMCIYGGFMMLLLMHALSSFTTAKLFPDYAPTLNPFWFLRDLFGAVVILGLVLAIYRRLARKPARFPNRAMDFYAIGIVAVILVSGLLLEGTKIISRASYQDMVDQYMTLDDEESAKALEAYWVTEFGLAAPDLKGPFDAKTLEEGKSLHEMSCAQCHSPSRWAFAGNTAAKLLKPLASGLDRAHAASVLWVIHYLACLIGLAYLPFSKMFHIIATPLTLLTNAVMERGRSDPANIATRQVLELDSCTHCGGCTSRCSVAVAFEQIPNRNILPSEKIASIKALAAGKELSRDQIRGIQFGMHFCTNCNRCTSVCPSGINLADLWISVREALHQKALPEPLLLSPLSTYRGLMNGNLDRKIYAASLDRAKAAVASECNLELVHNKTLPIEPGKENGLLHTLRSSELSNSFSNCYRCMTCSVSCPVVRNYAHPQETLGLLPHQLMYAVNMKLWDLVFSSQMLWDCLGCYQCQENCPQCVCITDILYELKNLAISRAAENPSEKVQDHL